MIAKNNRTKQIFLKVNSVEMPAMTESRREQIVIFNNILRLGARFAQVSLEYRFLDGNLSYYY